MLLPGTESREDHSVGRPHTAAAGQGDCLVKAREDERTQDMQGWRGRSSHTHSGPAWDAKASPEQQMEHLREQKPWATPALLLASSQL